MIRTTIAQPKRMTRTSDVKPAARLVRTFRSAVNFLNSLTNYERVIGSKYTATNFNLARMNRLLSALDNPHRKLKTVHVVGTKGKGSTAAMLSEMLRGCGLRVGLSTSPHILDVRERIVVDGEMSSEL